VLGFKAFPTLDGIEVTQMIRKEQFGDPFNLLS